MARREKEEKLENLIKTKVNQILNILKSAY
jgi:hypothetical protein